MRTTRYSARRHGLAAATLTAALVLAGCGTSSDDGPSQDKNGASQETEAGPLKAGDTTEPVIADPTYAPGAVATLGGGKTAAAVTEPVVGLIRDLTFSDRILSVDELGDDSSKVRDDIDQTLSKYATASVRNGVLSDLEQFIRDSEAEKSGEAAQRNLWTAFAFAALSHGEEATVKGKKQLAVEDGPVLVNPKLRRLRVQAPADDGRVTVQARSTIQGRVTLGGKPHRYDVAFNTDYFLLKVGQGWKVDGYGGRYVVKGPNPE